MSVHETARPIHLTERDRWLSECSCGWEQVARTEVEARLAWKNHKSAMDEQTERLTLSNDRSRNEARDPDVASIEEAFLYVAPVHASVVRDAQAALRRLVEEIDKWHREALDWQQAKSEADSDYEECATQRDMAREQADGYKRDFLAASERVEIRERELARLRQERDEALREAEIGKWPKEKAQEFHHMKAELARLQEGLRLTHAFVRERIEDGHPGLLDMHLVEDKFRDLLAEDGAA